MVEKLKIMYTTNFHNFISHILFFLNLSWWCSMKWFCYHTGLCLPVITSKALRKKKNVTRVSHIVTDWEFWNGLCHCRSALSLRSLKPCTTRLEEIGGGVLQKLFYLDLRACRREICCSLGIDVHWQNSSSSFEPVTSFASDSCCLVHKKTNVRVKWVQ